MTYDPDLIDEYRKPEYHPEYISWDEGVDRYENDDPDEFVANAIDTLCGTAIEHLPAALVEQLKTWYRATSTYEESVQHEIDKAAE